MDTESIASTEDLNQDFLIEKELKTLQKSSKEDLVSDPTDEEIYQKLRINNQIVWSEKVFSGHEDSSEYGTRHTAYFLVPYGNEEILVAVEMIEAQLVNKKTVTYSVSIRQEELMDATKREHIRYTLWVNAQAFHLKKDSQVSIPLAYHPRIINHQVHELKTI